MMKLWFKRWQHAADFEHMVAQHDAKDARNAQHRTARHAQDVADRASLPDQMCKVFEFSCEAVRKCACCACWACFVCFR